MRWPHELACACPHALTRVGCWVAALQVHVLAHRTQRRELQMEKTRAAMNQRKINKAKLERLEADILRANANMYDTQESKDRRNQARRYSLPPQHACRTCHTALYDTHSCSGGESV
eukprot:1114044-Prorocentrum_minimum.AAC.6